MPVWHASLSLQSAGSWVRSPALLRRIATVLLADVGGSTEWFIWRAPVAHLRVALTPAEFALVPPGQAVADAGDSGPPEPRRRLP